MSLSLPKVHQLVFQTLKKTDQLVLQYFQGKKELDVKTKGYRLDDLVTQADTQIQALLKKTFKKAFPQIGFIGEEADVKEIKDYNWIVDPIDGTLNFSYKVPIFGTSVALWHQNKPLYGIISFPALNQTIYALKNKGVYLNNRKIKSRHFHASNFVVFSSGGNSKKRLKTLIKLLEIVPLPRSYVCSTYQGLLAILKEAKAGVFLANAIWDIGAVIPLALEAGLYTQFITPWPDMNDPDIRAYKHSLVIGEKELVKKIISRLGK